MLADFHFIRPEWLWALPLVILATVLLVFRRLGAGNWQTVVSPALAPFVLSRSANRQGRYRWWLLGLGGVLAVLALAGPAWQRIDQGPERLWRHLFGQCFCHQFVDDFRVRLADARALALQEGPPKRTGRGRNRDRNRYGDTRCFSRPPGFQP